MVNKPAHGMDVVRMSARLRSRRLLTWPVVLLLAMPASALQWSSLDGAARGYPVMRDRSGKKIADGDFVQWIEKDRLRVKISYTAPSHEITETGVFRQRPELVQEAWSFRETKNGQVVRSFEVDFVRGTANAVKMDEGKRKAWSERVTLPPGQSFAGFGFSLAIRALHQRLLKGERVELQTVGFMPKPRAAHVELSFAGIDRIGMSDRTMRGERFIVHPKVPWYADLFIDVPDAHIWLTTPAPAVFLRWEGALAEPKDPLVRVDVLPGGASQAAVPVTTTDTGDRKRF